MKGAFFKLAYGSVKTEDSGSVIVLTEVIVALSISELDREGKEFPDEGEISPEKRLLAVLEDSKNVFAMSEVRQIRCGL
jgi:hypothetical protein